MTAGGIVLCGGRSTRMGSSKALLPFGAETMLQRVVRLLGTVASPLVAVAAPGQELPELPPSVSVTRDEREGRGPLEGLRAGLKALPVDVEIAYVTSCDVPLLVPQFVERMVQLLADHDIAVMEIDGFAHPLSAVYQALDASARRGAAGRRPVTTRVSVRRREDASSAARGDSLRRSSAVDASQSQYARGLPGRAGDGGAGRADITTGPWYLALLGPS